MIPRRFKLISLAFTLALFAAPAFAQSALENPAGLREQAPATYKARFDTTKGVFVIEVTRAWAPKGADRFYNLVKNGFYDNARFFRVISGFMRPMRPTWSIWCRNLRPMRWRKNACWWTIRHGFMVSDHKNKDCGGNAYEQGDIPHDASLRGARGCGPDVGAVERSKSGLAGKADQDRLAVRRRRRRRRHRAHHGLL